MEQSLPVAFGIDTAKYICAASIDLTQLAVAGEFKVASYFSSAQAAICFFSKYGMFFTLGYFFTLFKPLSCLCENANFQVLQELNGHC